MFGLAPYRISITSSDGDHRLDSFNQKDDFLDFLHKYHGDLGKEFRRVGEDKKLYCLSELGRSRDGRCLAGIYETGDWGYGARLIDIQKLKTAHNRKTSEAELLPYFFAYFVPRHTVHGVLILQRFKNFGIRKYVTPDLLRRFAADFPGFHLHIDRIVPRTAARALLTRGQLKAVRLAISRMPTDIADALTSVTQQSPEVQFELVVSARRTDVLSKAKWFGEILSGRRSYSDVLTMKNWDVAGVKLEMEINGMRRTLDLGSPGRITPTLDISGDVEIDPDNGHVQFEPVWELAQGFALELFDGLGVAHRGTSLDRNSFMGKRRRISTRAA